MAWHGPRENQRLGAAAQEAKALARDAALLRARMSLDSFQFAALTGCGLRRARVHLHRLERHGDAVRVPGSLPVRFVLAF